MWFEPFFCFSINNTLMWLFISVVFIQLIYYWLVFSRLAFYKKKCINPDMPSISVVIAAKNEYENLKRFLILILDQDYPDFEVVVVNDMSEDDTSYYLRSLSEKYNNLKVVTLIENVNFFSGKKFPLSIGIKSAKNELLLLIDADCKPASNQWIKSMVSAYDSQTDIVLGYGKYEESNSFLNRLIRYDTFHIALQYMSFALIGLTYMGVGRNLSYKKSLFYKHNGFMSHYKVRSGDDDLFINQAAKKDNTNIQISHDSHTISIPKNSFNDWFIQKRRHFSTSGFYKAKHKLLLGLYSLSQILFYVLAIMLSIFMHNLIIIFSLIFLRFLSQFIIAKKTLSKLGERKILLFLPLLELIMIIINLPLAFSGIFNKENKWK